MGDGIRCMLMRGGTSKGAYFLETDLPADPAERDRVLMAIMGSGDPRQIDGIGGAHPLTSKIAVVRPSQRPDADVEYLFLQTGVERAFITDAQNCGNLLAGVGPFAIERGLIPPDPAQDRTEVRIFQRNDASLATASVDTRGGQVRYHGTATISGVPGTAAAIPLYFSGIAGSTCGALYPTGKMVEEVEGLTVTAVDNGMPTVVLLAAELGRRGDETPAELEADEGLRRRLEHLRLAIGPRMGLGTDVTALTVPKLTLLSAARHGGTAATRTFIPHRCHDAIGVLGAVSVATACLTPGTAAFELSGRPTPDRPVTLEHPTGATEAVVELDLAPSFSPSTSPGLPTSRRAGVLRTARKLFDGLVFPPELAG
ncbi:MAG: 4-oxalomesaconate tautomerase [Acidimicrobiales bacterium]